ncbi:MAG: hypothetical protein ABSC04_06095 [Syntrophobacteraceae bacterium]|jgi:hypothetical protein
MDYVYTFLAIGEKYMSLDVVARCLSDVEIGWNSFRAPFLASGGFAGESLAGFEGELLLCGWRGLSPARKFRGASWLVLHNRTSRRQNQPQQLAREQALSVFSRPDRGVVPTVSDVPESFVLDLDH